MEHHINLLYGAVILLLIIQLVSFTFVSSQSAKLIGRQQNFEERINGVIGELRQENQYRVGEIVRSLSQQRTDFENQLEYLKSTQQDFSLVIEDALKKVVTVTTDISAGTGFAIGDGSYILTNNHVIEGGKVDYFGLADSDEVQIGEKVIAIGNPLGLSFTVTEGIVSALHREGPSGLDSYIQTDVTLNPGNSGGPLVNKEGKIIAMANFKVGGAEALGFGLESNTLRKTTNEIVGFDLLQ